MAGDFEPKPGDPADREAPVNHRAGYGENKLQRIERWARQGNTLAAGEGAALVEELDRVREEARKLVGCLQGIPTGFGNPSDYADAMSEWEEEARALLAELGYA